MADHRKVARQGLVVIDPRFNDRIGHRSQTAKALGLAVPLTMQTT
jgi:hypothetical protein